MGSKEITKAETAINTDYCSFHEIKLCELVQVFLELNYQLLAKGVELYILSSFDFVERA